MNEEAKLDLEFVMDPCRFCAEKMLLREDGEGAWFYQCRNFGEGCQVVAGPFPTAEDAVLRWNGV